MLWNCQTFLAGLPLAGRRTSIYSSVRMPHLQNCVMILNLRVLGMVGGGCGQCERSKIRKMSWEKGMWYSGGRLVNQFLVVLLDRPIVAMLRLLLPASLHHHHLNLRCHRHLEKYRMAFGLPPDAHLVPNQIVHCPSLP